VRPDEDWVGCSWKGKIVVGKGGLWEQGISIVNLS